MSFSYSAESIENLKNQIDIVDVVGQVVTLKRSGASLKGLCPFHNEKTASFFVSESRQHYTCFGCGASGDVISFVQKYYNMDFVEALEKLAEQYGIEMKRTGREDNRGEYYEINRLAARFFYDSFTQQANTGYAYMKRRGIAPNTLKKFGIGYADGGWDSCLKYLRSKGVEEKKLQVLGLVSVGKGHSYDKFRERVMFPIINTGGKVIGFGGRAIRSDDEPKYLNSPESIVFQKKNNLYALNTARQAAGKAGYLILVEGYMDVISLYQSGIHNVAASLGTALTENQARLIRRYVKDVVLSYDADKAGRAAALRGIEVLRKEGIKVRVLHVTDGKDPDEYIKKNGKDAFLKLVEGALPYGDYKLESAKMNYDLSTDQGRIDYMKAAVDMLADMTPIEQEVYKQKLAKDLTIGESAIDRELAMRAGRKPSQPERRRRHAEEEDGPVISLTPVEKTLLVLAVTDADFVEKVAEHQELLPSPLSARVLEILRKNDPDEQIKRDDLFDALRENERTALQEALANIVLGADHEGVYQDCLRTGRKELLKRQEEEIKWKIQTAEQGDVSDQVIRELTGDLMRIQDEIRKCR